MVPVLVVVAPQGAQQLRCRDVLVEDGKRLLVELEHYLVFVVVAQAVEYDPVGIELPVDAAIDCRVEFVLEEDSMELVRVGGEKALELSLEPK